MQLIQILLPIPHVDGASALYRQINNELTERFGGVTAFSRTPAEGLWEDKSGKRERDDIILIEVMAETFDRGWWSIYREHLERRLKQDRIVVRVQEIALI